MILGVLLCAGGAVLLACMPGGCDYILPAPDFSAEEPVAQELEKLRRVMEIPWAAALRRQGAQIGTENRKNIPATVYAVSEGYFDIAHEMLAEGRPLNGEDIRAGAARAMISRRGAESLFYGMNPIGKTLRVGDWTLEIIGTVEGSFRPGEKDEILVFIPISLADRESLTFQTMEIKTAAVTAEEKALAAATIRNWKPGGTVQDSERLRLGALMPLWLIACGMGIWLLGGLLRRLGRLTVSQREWARGRLQTMYPSQAAPGMALRAAGLLLLLAAWIGAVWLLLQLAVRPLYVFTEWIPDTPVDPESVWATAKKLMQEAAASAVYRNRAAGIAEMAAWLMGAGSLIFLTGLVPFGRGWWKGRH